MAVSITTLSQDIYAAIRTLLVANKPSYTYDSVEYQYSIVAEYGDQNTSFPYIVINPVVVDPMLLNIDGSGEDYPVEVQLDFFALQIHRKKAIDVGVDSVRNTVLTSQTTLKDTDGLLLMENPLEESNTAPFEDNSQKLNTKSVTIKLKVQ